MNKKLKMENKANENFGKIKTGYFKSKKIKATSNKIRKYDQKFYRSIGSKQIKLKTPPNQQKLETFWKTQISNPQE